MMALLLDRRSLIVSAGSLFAGRLLDFAAGDDGDYGKADQFIRDALDGTTPGIAACVVRGDQIEWAAGYGWANIAGKVPMTADTIQNIASISKTITATAVMQLWEENKLGLDEDINEYLPFAVRNPHFTTIPITVRQLLTHTSSIADGPAYEASYACGDPDLSLMDWLRACFDTGGEEYDAVNNFLRWRPGGGNEYSNLGFGILGGIVESVAGMQFAAYCERRIFAPLGMNNTGWYLKDLDERQHAVPYGSAPDRRFQPPTGNGSVFPDPNHHAYCLYSFPNYPDGLLRTSVNDLSRFLRSYIGTGQFNASRVLDESTVRTVLTESHTGQGLCWRHPQHLNADPAIWGHGGSDPGVRTTMDFSERLKRGVIVFSNFDGWDLVPRISHLLFSEPGAI